MTKRRTFSLVSIAAIAALTALYFASTQESIAQNDAQHDHAHEHDAANTTIASDHPLTQIQDADKVLGEADAPVTIIEYSSMSCPHCAAFHKELLPHIKTNYIEKGIVKYTNRAFPLNEPALRAAMLTKCVDDDKYFTFTNVLFDMQDKWAFTPAFLEDLKKIATVGGFSPDKFDACMADKTLEDAMITSRQEATEALNINATPTFFINGVELKGHLTKEGFDAAIAVAQDKAATDKE